MKSVCKREGVLRASIVANVVIYVGWRSSRSGGRQSVWAQISTGWNRGGLCSTLGKSAGDLSLWAVSHVIWPAPSSCKSARPSSQLPLSACVPSGWAGRDLGLARSPDFTRSSVLVGSLGQWADESQGPRSSTIVGWCLPCPSLRIVTSSNGY